jgi:octaprenyl-diphosphate synthase
MAAPDLQTIIEPARADMQAVDALITRRLASAIPTVNQLAQYIVAGGGKRLRPVNAILAGLACGSGGARLHTLAVLIEFIHTATLLHDDVVDASQLRRGRATANHRFGNDLAVLVGDFLYSRAFQLMVELGDLRVMDLLANATNVIAEGEVMQAAARRNPDLDEAHYLEVIRRKTATLFEAASRGAALLARAPPGCAEALGTFGREFGLAYQLVDDLLDYAGDPHALGKNVGDDLAQGTPTLPLLYALRNAPAAEQDALRAAIRGGACPDLGTVRRAIESTGALAAHHARAAAAAAAELPESSARRALLGLAEFVIERDR